MKEIKVQYLFMSKSKSLNIAIKGQKAKDETTVSLEIDEYNDLINQGRYSKTFDKVYNQIEKIVSSKNYKLNAIRIGCIKDSYEKDQWIGKS